jgi:DNA-binding LacI/PurR family transcriptional regulator
VASEVVTRLTDSPSPRRTSLRPSARSTINDVAALAGVSRQTVSNVVRSRGRVGEKTRLRVLAAIDSLNYKPHVGASSMRSQRTGRLAHPMPAGELTPGDLGMVEFLHALVDSCGRRDQQLLLTPDPNDRHTVIEDLIRSGSVDGFLLAHVAPHDPRVQMLSARQIPFACFGRTDPHLPQSWIDLDNRGATGLATEHLLEAGHTRVTFVGYDTGSYWDRDREHGYRAAMDAAGLVADVVLTRQGTGRVHDMISAMLLPSRPPPTAIVAGDDLIAATVYSVAATLGVGIGDDLAVVGYGGGILSQLLSPPLTTLCVPVDDVAARLVDRLLRELDHSSDEPGELVTLSLRPGDSA